MMVKFMVTVLMFSGFGFLFDTQGYGELRKYGGDLKRRSALGKIEIEVETFEWNGVKNVIFGFQNVWMGRDVGLIQLDPQEADYLLGTGFKKEFTDKWFGAYLDHTCYHKIDTFVDRSLYWNKLKLLYSNQDLKKFFTPGIIYYRLEMGFYLRHPDISWLTVGNPNQFDFLAKFHYTVPYGSKVMPFFDVSLYSGVTLQYNFTPEIELNVGIAIRGSYNEGLLYVGIRPLDKKGYREAQGAPYLGLKAKF
ncbi:MAG TPA: hypothetical protein PKU94_05480 [Candidatus Hydrothermia bacterium]|nr:hypothetical protein [Candidatus Hydrothermae bacterium]MDD3649595.1 hypothetical protein [Candidatus Hydrothermia bacterium]MDD5573432.1 hypothetical protein [Candidatus Hydrothermia bacterium]HOK23507.1 hypothetical protein [Candidatus Hydrothermia bacterium]HOL24049.1 hypothetical protein [Candidatus Hydrothermia bacterium]